MTIKTEAESGQINPLLKTSDAPPQAVAFDIFKSSAYETAIQEAITIHNKEIDAITSSKEAPIFENTIAAFDRSGSMLNQSVLTLSNLESALGDTVLMNIMAKVTPIISEHSTNILLNEELWKRIKSVYDNRDSRVDISPEAMRLIEETYRGFAESGANLQGEDRERYRRLSSELSDLNVKFSQNVTNAMADP
ncbi:MAG: peptidase M3, partial [Muribaculaceae bacterium]|nr:peptidase M3 [Muribaculaceae bacterium]